MKIIEFYAVGHLGDAVYHLDFLRKVINRYPKKFKFIYYVEEQYLNELQAHIYLYEKNIKLKNLTEKSESAISSWIENGDEYTKWRAKNKNVKNYNEFYIEWYNHLSDVIGIPPIIEKAEETLFYHPSLLNKQKEYDYLVINSEPRSGQFAEYSVEEFMMLCIDLNKHGNSFITTKKVRNYECTLDLGYNLIEIGSLACHVKYIIGVNTSPMITCINKLNISKVKHFGVLNNDMLIYNYNENFNRYNKVSDYVYERSHIIQKRNNN